MFKSISWDIEDNVLLEDSDFLDKTIYCGPFYKSCGNFTIDCYKKRNLNVVSNFVLMMRYMEENFYSPLKSQMLHYENHCHYFIDYKKDIEKYLVLI
jgi:hypothetical protein